VQVDPTKPMLNPPGTKRLKLKYDELLQSFAFNFDLRRYTEAGPARGSAQLEEVVSGVVNPLYHLVAGAYIRPPFSST